MRAAIVCDASNGGLDAHVARRVPGRRIGREPRRPGMDHVQLVAAQRRFARRPGHGRARALRAVGSDHDASHAALQSRGREHIIAPAGRARGRDLPGCARRNPGMNRRELLLAAAAAPAALALPAAARAAARGGTPLALVTADSEDRDPRRAAHRPAASCARSPCPHEPHGIEAVDQLRSALVMSNESGTITVLDADARGCAGCSRASPSPRYAAGRSARPASRTSATTWRGRSSPSTCGAHA